MSNNNVPELINIKSAPVGSAQQVETDVLEPLTFSDTEALWEFQPKGFLHPQSTLIIGFKNNANVGGAFPYVNVGIHSLVERAVLRTSAGRVICDTNSWGHLESIKSMFVNNITNTNREQYLNGRMMNYQSGFTFDTTNNVYDNNKSSGYLLENGLEVNVATGDDQGLSPLQHLKHSSGSTLQIKLHDLFPYMKSGNQLPLFLLPNERIQVQLFWSPTANRLSLPASLDGQTGAEILLDRSKCKIYGDYVFYDERIMEAERKEYESGKAFEYIDYLLNTTLKSTTEMNSENIINIGGAGRVVNKVYYSVSDPNGNDLDLVGSYNSMSTDDNGNNKELATSNVFVNGNFIYPRDVVNFATHFHNLKEAGGMVPFVSRGCYSGEGKKAISDLDIGEFAGRDIRVDLADKFFAQGVDLRGLNQKIDQKGIDLHLKNWDMADLSGQTLSNYKINSWLEVRRYLIIKDGHLECYYV
jgi:hypothetical protein